MLYRAHARLDCTLSLLICELQHSLAGFSWRIDNSAEVGVTIILPPNNTVPLGIKSKRIINRDQHVALQ